MSLIPCQVIRQSLWNVFVRRELSGIRPCRRFSTALLPVAPRAFTRHQTVSPLRERARQQGTLAGDLTGEVEPLPISNSGRLSAALSACPGCGGLAQTVDPGTAGFYTMKRKVVASFLVHEEDVKGRSGSPSERQLYSSAVENASSDLVDSLHLSKAELMEDNTSAAELPLCDRCHHLLHHHVGVPIHHPSLDSIQATISESPHKYNHIYHVIDAADFPLSLIPKIQKILELSPQRTKNRRAKHAKYSRGRLAELSFIITRSDLLAPKKEQVDRLMPYLTQVLRDALGSSSRAVRLGNVRCVSSKRGWWTQELKSDIWRRGGGGWMVGKVNVGKSNLFEVAFPKGRNEDINFAAVRDKARLGAIGGIDDRHEDEIALRQHEEAQEAEDIVRKGRNENVKVNSARDEARLKFIAGIEDRDEAQMASRQSDEAQETENDENALLENSDIADEGSDLLPPLRAETPYPVMPTISSLPGTTASPIRIPFGGGRGELVDLPGLARSSLDTFVKPEDRDSMVMKRRVIPEQHTIKPGQTLLLGGLIRIDPCFSPGSNKELVILAYPFVPLRPHLTSTIKANEIQSGERVSGVPMIVDEEGRKAMKSAGRFQLKWDVTKQRAGPLTTSSGAGLKTKTLPFNVLSTDILIEGVGWVELVAQVRKTRNSKAAVVESAVDAVRSTSQPDKPSNEDPLARLEARASEATCLLTSDDELFPEVEVFSPNGIAIGSRRPLGAWLLGGEKAVTVADKKSRPRRSMASSGRGRR